MNAIANPSGLVKETVVSLDKMLLYIRGGSIFGRKDIARRSSTSMKHDPMTIVVALNSNGRASGSAYIDDGESYEYEERRAFARIQFEASVDENVLNIEWKVDGETSLLPDNLLQANQLVLIRSSGHEQLKVDLHLGKSSRHQFKL